MYADPDSDPAAQINADPDPKPWVPGTVGYRDLLYCEHSKDQTQLLLTGGFKDSNDSHIFLTNLLYVLIIQIQTLYLPVTENSNDIYYKSCI